MTHPKTLMHLKAERERDEAYGRIAELESQMSATGRTLWHAIEAAGGEVIIPQTQLEDAGSLLLHVRTETIPETGAVKLISESEKPQ